MAFAGALAMNLAACSGAADTQGTALSGKIALGGSTSVEKVAGGDLCAISAALDLLMAARYLERIGDHAVNLAEWVVFSITGTHPKRGPGV